jgi:hypothetical protein
MLGAEEQKKSWVKGDYFFFGLAGFVLRLGFAFVVVFSCLTCFIGTPQQITSQSSQPQISSTKTTSPHSSHLYLSPFFFAKKITCQENDSY